MVINENNSQINSFTKGMNSDSAYDQIENTQYVFGQNIRITKNQPIGGSGDYSSVHEGIVTPVLSGTDVINGVQQSFKDKNILSVLTIERLGIIVCNPKGTKDLEIYRFILDETTDTIEENKFQLIWASESLWDGDVPAKLSTVLYKELENVIKLYIADGEHPIISLRVDDDSYMNYQKSDGHTISYTDKDYLMNNRIIPTKRLFINEVISGRLTTSQVLYTYRYYNKYGNTTQLAPLTNKIQIIDYSRSKEIGNAENTETSIGLSLTLDTSVYKDEFERIQVFRLLYITPGQNAEVSLIYDGKIKETKGRFVINDEGINALQSYTMEEFSAMSGLILIPLTIELNQEYLFCGNIKDDTILRDVSIVGTPDILEVHAPVILSKSARGGVPDPGNTFYKDDLYGITDNNGNIVCRVVDYLKQRGVNNDLVKTSYNDMFTSSLLRSLRRDELYKYAIIFYDKYGRRTDVLRLEKDVKVSSIAESPTFYLDGKLKADVIGVKIEIPTLTAEGDDSSIKDIIGCQIVRRSSSEVYQKTLLQVALARPLQQGLLDITVTDPSTIEEDSVLKSPFYPSGFLSTNNMVIQPSFYNFGHKEPLWAKTKNKTLYQIFSSEIDFRRNDVLSKLSFSDLNIVELAYVSAVFGRYMNSVKLNTYNNEFPDWIENDTVNNRTEINRDAVEKLTLELKQARHWIFDFYLKENELSGFNNGSEDGCPVNQIKDVKMADWNSAFTDVVRKEDLNIDTAIKKYRSYTTNIDSFTYNNWVSFCKYNLKAGNGDATYNDPNETWHTSEMIGILDQYKLWFEDGGPVTGFVRNGFIGPGPSCFLLTTKEETGGFSQPYPKFYTSICNITHNPKTEDLHSEEFEPYYGFGNYFNLKYIEGKGLRTEDPDGNFNQDYMLVFDGDVYITPHEFTTMYKTYNFESIDTLQSTQITNYIPLESKVNTCFDYGMNLVNTNSENILYEPGMIDGVTTQERPVHLYNIIYSDNDESNDVFTLISTEKDETNNFKLRTYYSELKSNGEYVDNFLIFKPAAFIDVDSRYGQITNLYTDKNILYYWQDHAFGKFSVNERSLVNDLNSNTIMLGQAGILSRYDYMSTKYGMRLHDFCSRNTENGLFWVDINNKAVVGTTNGLVINYGEYTNVLNIINDKITTDVPDVDYDLQNNELLCKCFGSDLIVFNLKYTVATSIYTRKYDAIAYIKNHIYGITNTDDGLTFSKYNYIQYNPETEYAYLSPLMLSFVVNPSASATKVFDSLQLVPIKRHEFTNESVVDLADILNDTTFAFETDIVKKQYGDSMEPHTDREGNIIYNVPRYLNQQYGNRIRGKWMKVDINNNNPSEYFTISHMITKFRQSFS